MYAENEFTNFTDYLYRDTDSNMDVSDDDAHAALNVGLPDSKAVLFFFRIQRVLLM